MKLLSSLILHGRIGDAIGSPTLKQRSNEDQGRLVRLGEPAFFHQSLFSFSQTVNRNSYRLTAGREPRTTELQRPAAEVAKGGNQTDWHRSTRMCERDS